MKKTYLKVSFYKPQSRYMMSLIDNIKEDKKYQSETCIIRYFELKEILK